MVEYRDIKAVSIVRIKFRRLVCADLFGDVQEKALQLRKILQLIYPGTLRRGSVDHIGVVSYNLLLPGSSG